MNEFDKRRRDGFTAAQLALMDAWAEGSRRLNEFDKRRRDGFTAAQLALMDAWAEVLVVVSKCQEGSS